MFQPCKFQFQQLPPPTQISLKPFVIQLDQGTLPPAVPFQSNFTVQQPAVPLLVILRLTRITVTVFPDFPEFILPQLFRSVLPPHPCVNGLMLHSGTAVFSIAFRCNHPNIFPFSSMVDVQDVPTTKEVRPIDAILQALASPSRHENRAYQMARPILCFSRLVKWQVSQDKLHKSGTIQFSARILCYIFTESSVVTVNLTMITGKIKAGSGKYKKRYSI